MKISLFFYSIDFQSTPVPDPEMGCVGLTVTGAFVSGFGGGLGLGFGMRSENGREEKYV